MEERPVPPPGHVKDNSYLLTAPSVESKDTYVVKVPRDQVYRIPPPENARIVEEYTKNAPNKDKNNRCFSGPVCWIISALAILAIVLVALIMIVRATLYNPKAPEFSVTQIMAKNLNQDKGTPIHPPMYEISLGATNPNSRLSISYHGPGEASLIFTNHKIGHGGIQSSAIKEDPNQSENILVTLSGKGVSLSPAIQSSLIHKMEKAMNLNMQVSMEVNSWLKNEVMNLQVSCDFRVNNSLMNHTRITFEECTSKF